MNAREQFLKTLNHQQPGRIVLDLGSTGVTGIHIKALSKLRRHFGLQRKPLRVIDPFQMLGDVDWELIDPVGIDVVGVCCRKNIFGFPNQAPFREWKTPWRQRVMVPMGFNVTTDENGDILIYPEGDSAFPPSAKMAAAGFAFEPVIRQESASKGEMNPEDNVEEFGLLDEKELEHWRTACSKAHASGKAVIATVSGTSLGNPMLIPGMKLRRPKGIRDINLWYKYIVSKPAFIKKIFDRQSEIAIENLSRIFAVSGNKIDAIFLCGTDFGSPDFAYSPEQFEEIWLPYYKRMNDWIHENTQWKTFKHSYGTAKGFPEQFIKAGFDIINPVQGEESGLNPKDLKKKYGRSVVFWGGGVDTRKTLQFGTPEQVREEVLRNSEAYIKNGGFVFSASHNISATTPVENIVAMLKAVREFNGN